MIDMEKHVHARLDVNINNDCAEILRAVKTDRGISTTEAVRRALAWLAFREDLHRRGHRIVVELPTT